MEKNNQLIIKHLEKLVKIYEVLQENEQEIQEIKKIITILNKTEEKVMVTSMTDKKQSTITDNIQFLENKQYERLHGTKVNYEEINNTEKVMNLIQQTSKTKLLRETTAMDLKLLYFLLSGEKENFKRTKDKMYETIKTLIRAKNRGKAFKQS